MKKTNDSQRVEELTGFKGNQPNSISAPLTYLGCSTKSWRLAVVWRVNNTAAAMQQINDKVIQKPVTCALSSSL